MLNSPFKQHQEMLWYMYDLTTHPEIARIYKQDFLLLKEQWDTYTDPPIPLNWKCVKFERGNANQIPTMKGIYAFFIEPRIAQFPTHGYLAYIGQAGYESERNLRKRFGDYLSEKTKPKRPLVNFMLNTWENHLYFYYTEVDPTQTDLRQLEQKLLDTFMPPFSLDGYSAEIGKMEKIARR